MQQRSHLLQLRSNAPKQINKKERENIATCNGNIKNCFWSKYGNAKYGWKLHGSYNIISYRLKPVNPKENQLWIFTGRIDAKAEAPILWPPDVKSRFIRKDTDAGKDGRQKKGAAEDEMVSITNSMDMNLSKLQEMGKDREA